MCLPRGIRYSLASPLSARMMILRCPLTKPPISTRPSISVMMACSLGLRASNSSATRGRPPVMSLVLVVSRGILAMMSAAKTSWPSRHQQVRAHGQGIALALAPAARRGRVRFQDDDARLQARVEILDDDLAGQSGDLVELLPHGGARGASPRLAASWASRSSTMSTYCTLPVNSVRMGVVCGSHSTSTVPAFTRGAGLSGSALTLTLAP